jgi:hypothetical protein
MACFLKPDCVYAPGEKIRARIEKEHFPARGAYADETGVYFFDEITRAAETGVGGIKSHEFVFPACARVLGRPACAVEKKARGREGRARVRVKCIRISGGITHAGSKCVPNRQAGVSSGPLGFS